MLLHCALCINLNHHAIPIKKPSASRGFLGVVDRCKLESPTQSDEDSIVSYITCFVSIPRHRSPFSKYIQIVSQFPIYSSSKHKCCFSTCSNDSKSKCGVLTLASSINKTILLRWAEGFRFYTLCPTQCLVRRVIPS